MTQGKDKWLKRIWFVNGILIFFISIVVVILLINDIREKIVDNMHANVEQGVIIGEEKEKADKDSLELQTIVCSAAQQIKGTDIYLTYLEQRDYATPKRVVNESALVSPYPSGMTVNLIFYNPTNHYTKRLLDTKASINIVNSPSSHYTPDSLQKNIYYEISTEDTDGNGRINKNDVSESYISNLDGSSFTKILSSKYFVEDYEFSSDYKKINFVCQIRPDDKEIHKEYWDRVFFVYDIPSGKLIKNTELNKEIAKAKEIMLR